MPNTSEDLNAQRQKRFLNKLLQNGGFVERAIRECHTSRRWLNDQLEGDEGFNALYQTIRDQNNEKIEEEIYRRAVSGNKEPVIFQGKLAGQWVDKEGNVCSPENPDAILVPLTKQVYSDNLLMFLAKANMPEKYRDLPQGKGATMTDDELNDRITRYFAKRKDTALETTDAVN